MVVFGLLKINSMRYSYAKLSKYDLGFFRILGDGLGNLLFPWARSVVAAKKYDATLIEPTWPQIKLGPILRREPDLRLYADLFHVSPEAIHGLKKILVLATEKKLPDISLTDITREVWEKYGRGVFVFKGRKHYFNDILQEHEFVKRKLLAIAKDIHKTGLSYDFTNSVNIHIRRGDFKIEGWTTSLDWFVWVMDELRKQLGSDIKFNIFSDGSSDELAPILMQKNTKRVFFGSALGDLLALSQSRVLVGSYNSTFSMWASYLGRMPTIWPEKGLFQPLHYESPHNEIELPLGEPFPPLFIKSLKNKSFL